MTPTEPSEKQITVRAALKAARAQARGERVKRTHTTPSRRGALPKPIYCAGGHCAGAVEVQHPQDLCSRCQHGIRQAAEEAVSGAHTNEFAVTGLRPY